MTDGKTFCTWSARELLGAYAKKEISPVEVLKDHLARAEKVNPSINALFGIRAGAALELAEQSQKRWMKGNPCGPIDGVPVLLKDSVKCTGFDYFHGSAGYDGSPAEKDAPPAARIREAGGVVFAKTTMPDFGMLAAGVSSAFGVVRNPWDTAANTGGSSAGSGAAVAAGIAPLAVGTDIAGSVRLPAAHSGLVGLKPSRGRIPHLAPSPLRAAGPMARNCDDAGLFMSVLVQPDKRDFESLPPCDASAFQTLDETPDDYLKGKRIGLMLDMGFGQALEPAVRNITVAAARKFESAGAIVETVPTVVLEDPMPFLNLFLQSRAHNELMSLQEERRHLVLAHLIEWSCRVESASAPELSDALYDLEDFKARVTEVLSPFDFVVSPAMTITRFPAEAVGADADDHFAHCSYAIPFNQTGAPAITICAGFVDKMPVSIQIAGNRYDDIGVFRAASIFERLRDFDIRWPEIPARSRAS
jgi:amidase/aspartyl-tRNA(Asn)/glutamyl-tRNA(Gln) amidotransferase subunit A